MLIVGTKIAVHCGIGITIPSSTPLLLNLKSFRAKAQIKTSALKRSITLYFNFIYTIIIRYGTFCLACFLLIYLCLLYILLLVSINEALPASQFRQPTSSCCSTRMPYSPHCTNIYPTYPYNHGGICKSSVLRSHFYCSLQKFDLQFIIINYLLTGNNKIFIFLGWYVTCN